MNDAAVWTDGRYFIQGDRQLWCIWQLMKSGKIARFTATRGGAMGGGGRLPPYGFPFLCLLGPTNLK